MLNDADRRVLEILNTKLLVTKDEVARQLRQDNANGTDLNFQKLKEMGLIEKVESLGTCWVITQKGMRALRGSHRPTDIRGP
ncbi:MAG: hypothetical protein HY518_03705 [Candidatus Aenigmarchaeota archaeon]|nr:hypothetical protein [Candidatus Aenigmarchaeota archaeon]